MGTPILWIFFMLGKGSHQYVRRILGFSTRRPEAIGECRMTPAISGCRDA